jgi:hypothetical protein
MRVTIYGIGGGLNEQLAGVAHDPVTALNLLHLIGWLGGTACSLHGVVRVGQAPYSGEMTLEAADRLFLEVREQRKQEFDAAAEMPH